VEVHVARGVDQVEHHAALVAVVWYCIVIAWALDGDAPLELLGQLHVVEHLLPPADG
jgi:hypothetical protein